MNDIKKAVTNYPVLDIIKNRWSPRSFSDKAIVKDDLNTILEAASWAFSAMNEQPWRYLVAQRGSALFNIFLESLYPGNLPWNRQAAALILSVQKTVYSGSGKTNESALHDIGAANILLTLQANSMGIYTHIIGGFNKEQLTILLQLDKNSEPVVLIALGYPDDAEKLEEPFKSRETSPRSRKALSEIILDNHLN
ncbi:MAG: nitroreductase family protein [Ferruginibacter sp.]